MNILRAWPSARSLIDALTHKHLSSLQQRQEMASEIAESIRCQLEALPDAKLIQIRTLTISVKINYCAGGGASMSVTG